MAKTFLMPDYWNDACAHLSARDPIMAGLIASYPKEGLQSRGDAFYSLTRSIIGQQVSVKAADSMWNKFHAEVQPMNPKTLATKTEEQLRACGLSRQKISYLLSLANHFLNGTVDPTNFPNMSDEEIIKALTMVKGIGSWTAEMFLIFHLLRPDVLPVKDIGVYKAVQKHYPKAKIELGKHPWKIADKWKPYRTVATWYLWRSLDPVAVEY